MVTELVLSDVTCGADGDLLDYAQVIGRPDLCAAAGIVCPDVDRANLQAKRPRHDRVSRFVVSRTAGVSLVNHVAIAPAAWDVRLNPARLPSCSAGPQQSGEQDKQSAGDNESQDEREER